MTCPGGFGDISGFRKQGRDPIQGGTVIFARFVITALVGLVLSLGSYYALHTVDFSPTTPDSTASAGSMTRVSTLPPPSKGESPLIRVCLTSGPVSSLELQVDGPFTLQSIGSETPLMKGKVLKETRVQCVGQTIRVGRQTLRGTRLELIPQTSPTVWVNGHQYRGQLRIYRQPGGKLLPINVLPLEDYIASVVDSEMPVAFPAAARKAQAIVSRTYAIYQMRAQRSHPYFDVYSSTRSQNYLGYQYLSKGRRLAGETKHGRQIADETAGLVCTHQGKVFCTYYSAVCGGRTTQGDLVFSDAAPPLKAVSCDWCREAKFYRWTEKFTKQTTTHKLASLLGSSRKKLNSIRREDNKPLTPASSFAATNGEKQVSLSAVDLRRRLSLPSNSFEVWEDSQHFLFQGRGHGHGVGLCQWGARGLALAGKTAAEILHYYYPGAQVAPLPW
ncbi:MAG: SpoIID/LytB domain-containing protein [Planctomycetaceae bacterium]|nr:SpoIID/LytB domain-containing protein [Planctomycetaceae bacterium]